ncbi:MAG: 50S ribosomal protein L19 [Pseudomonadota bacterium]|nr:50S ribosomal protein L19 [Pseudomonadota bacterium]
MSAELITAFENKQFKNRVPLPEFRSGDRVRVYYRLREGTGDKAKFRLQPFEGVVIRYRKGAAAASFTVRKISAGGIGVERVFPCCSAYIDKVEVMHRGKVRRARLYYLRQRSGKTARIKSRYVASGKS